MLTGTRLFGGRLGPRNAGTDLLARARSDDVAGRDTRTCQHLIARCLVKDPRQRLRDIGEARLALDDAHETPVRPSAPRWPRSGVGCRGARGGVVLVAAWALWSRTGPATPAPQVTHLEIGYPRDVETFPNEPDAWHLSRRPAVAIVGVRDGVRRVLVCWLDRSAATEFQTPRLPTARCSRPTAGAWRSCSRRGSSHALPWRTSSARS